MHPNQKQIDSLREMAEYLAEHPSKAVATEYGGVRFRIFAQSIQEFQDAERELQPTTRDEEGHYYTSSVVFSPHSSIDIHLRKEFGCPWGDESALSNEPEPEQPVTPLLERLPHPAA